ncbi:MAG: nucleotide exchange factor GrpE [Candidatus Micrarchaeota archaeon]
METKCPEKEKPDDVAQEKDNGELEQLREENAELIDDAKRLQAEFENYQKRVDKERASDENKGKWMMLEKLMLLADEFDAAVSHMHSSSESELRNGIRLLHKKLLSLMKEEGVEPIDCVGKKFNSDICDAVEMVEDEGEEGIVLREMRKGYVHDGGVLRHPMVAVSKKKSDD